jgi:hypothetical protein
MIPLGSDMNNPGFQPGGDARKNKPPSAVEPSQEVVCSFGRKRIIL